ncbi:YbaB/EbfC family nucleoid-associated protein [Streptomyces canarius]
MVSNPLQGYLDEAQSQLDEALARAGQAREALSGISAMATSKDRLVTVTVDARGTLTELKFNSSRYRSMAPSELSAVVTETIAKAQKDVTDQMKEIFGETDGNLDAVKDILGGSSYQDELHEMLEAFIDGRLPGQPKTD